MQQNAGTLLLNGVVQIVTSHVGNNSIPQGEVPEFMRSVSRALVECLIEANNGLSGQPAAEQRSVAQAQPPVAALAAPVAEDRSPEPVPTAEPSAAVAEALPVAEATRDEVAEEPVAEGAEEAVSEAGTGEATNVVERFRDLPTEPKVPISQSVTPDGIICLFDGQIRKMLHRHIQAKYGMSPDEYRTYWSLPPEYPMTAPSYSQEKRIVAQAQGLGTERLYDGVKARKAEEERQAAAAKSAKSRKAPGTPKARKSRAKQVA